MTRQDDVALYSDGGNGRSETVDATGETPLVETTRTQVSSTIDASLAADLPIKGRNFIDFVLLTPGGPHDVRRGQRGTLNSLTVDEVDDNNTLLRPDQGPDRLGPRALPVQPGCGAGIPRELEQLLA